VAINSGYEGQGAMDHGRRMVEEARAFKEAIGNQAESLTRSIDLRGRVQRNPLGMMLAAAGVGYILGGGLFSPFTARLLRYGLRIAIIPLVKSQLESIVGGAPPQPGEGAAGSTF